VGEELSRSVARLKPGSDFFCSFPPLTRWAIFGRPPEGGLHSREGCAIRITTVRGEEVEGDCRELGGEFLAVTTQRQAGHAGRLGEITPGRCRVS